MVLAPTISKLKVIWRWNMDLRQANVRHYLSSAMRPQKLSFSKNSKSYMNVVANFSVSTKGWSSYKFHFFTFSRFVQICYFVAVISIVKPTRGLKNIQTWDLINIFVSLFSKNSAQWRKSSSPLCWGCGFNKVVLTGNTNIFKDERLNFCHSKSEKTWHQIIRI